MFATGPAGCIGWELKPKLSGGDVIPQRGEVSSDSKSSFHLLKVLSLKGVSPSVKINLSCLCGISSQLLNCEYQKGRRLQTLVVMLVLKRLLRGIKFGL